MSQTPGVPDGFLVPPLWLQENDLTQDDLDKLKVWFLAAVEHGGPPRMLGERPARFRWWEWRPVQWWWYRQYKRADRRALRRECEQIRWRETWRPNGG
jgi:hypothetical protein